MSHYDRIAASAPINRNAALSTGRGESWAPSVQLQNTSDTVPPLRKPSREARANPNFQDLTGRTFGRLTVLGIHAERAKSGGARWVCRCRCGQYAQFRARTLLDGDQDRCGACDYTRQLREQTLRGMKNDRGAT